MMTNIQYGLISKTDARTLEKTIDLICEQYESDFIFVTEVGVFDGQTSRGINEYIESKDKACMLTCIDNEKDKPILKPIEYCNLIIGNSTEVYNALADNSQHLIFIDGDHSYIGVISDFYAYESKVKVGGYLAFHDTGKHIKLFKDWQRKGSEGDSDMYISVRKALKKMTLIRRPDGFALDIDEVPKNKNIDIALDEIRKEYYLNGNLLYNSTRLTSQNLFPQWELIFDEADPSDECGGICVFKKLY